MKYNNLIDVQKTFADENVCKSHLEKLRWNGKPVCPHCNSKNPYKTNRGYKCSNPECYKKFSVTVGTFFENTKIQLSKWFIAMYLVTSHKKGLSSMQLSKDIDVSQKTAWFMLHRIRLMLSGGHIELLEGIVEADETFIGGQNKNRHKHKRVENTQGRSLQDKVPVIGLYERGGKLITKPITDTSMKNIHPFVTDNVKAGSKLVTDEWTGYSGLNRNYNHHVVKHGEGHYVINDIHTNNLEGFWSLLKRGIVGIYHRVSNKHLGKYCDEFGFRYNTRTLNEAQRFDLAISQCSGRLKYYKLIEKTMKVIFLEPEQMELFTV